MKAVVFDKKFFPRSFSFLQSEVKLFRMLKNVNSTFGLTTELRIAGSWVRDKLLGIDSCNIDLMLDNLTGSSLIGLIN